MKYGRLSLEERDFIKANYTRFSYKEMATKLERKVGPIRSFVEKNLGKNLVSQTDFENKNDYDIKRQPYWIDIQKQFDKEEQDMFIFHFKKFVSQFKDDVLPTEISQIVDAIKLDIMKNRLLTYQQDNKTMITSTEKMLQDEKDKDPQDINVIITMQDQIATLRVSQESISKEYRELQQEKNRLYTAMKATRDARIKNIESSKVSFNSWLSELLNNSELRRSLGLKLEKMRLATEVEKRRLAAPKTYLDGTIDMPLFSSETIKLREEQEKEENEEIRNG